jgi:hypothetical protein
VPEITQSIDKAIANKKNPFFEGTIYSGKVQEIVTKYLQTDFDDLSNIEYVTSLIHDFVKEYKCSRDYYGCECGDTVQILSDMLNINITFIDATGESEVIKSGFLTRIKPELLKIQTKINVYMLKLNTHDRFYSLYQSKAVTIQDYKSNSLTISPVFTPSQFSNKTAICESLASMNNSVLVKDMLMPYSKDEFTSKFITTNVHKNLKSFIQLAKLGTKCQRCKLSRNAFIICDECKLSLCDSCAMVVETSQNCYQCEARFSKEALLAIYAMKVYNQKDTTNALSLLS